MVLKLLDSAKVTGDERKLCLTVTKDNTYEGMKAAIKQVFLKSMVNSGASSSGMSIKSEEAYYNFRSKSSQKSNQRFNYKTPGNIVKEKRLNPLNEDGTRSLCRTCGAFTHWKRDCLEGYRNRNRNILSPIVFV